MPAGSTGTGRSEHAGDGGRTSGLYGDELRKAVEQLAEEVGFSLTRAVVQGVAGKDHIADVRNNAKLTSVMEKLTDLARGIQRLKAAIQAAGSDVYARLCQELNLPSDSIDDIPNREVLRELVNRMEVAATRVGNSQPAKGAPGWSSPGPHGSNRTAANGSGPSGTTIAELRSRLLVEARRVSTVRRQGIGEVIAAASHGSFGFADLTKLTEADVGKVEASLEELARMTV
jgi:hypothetical protein